MEVTPDILDLNARICLFQSLAVCFGDPGVLEHEIRSGRLRQSLTEGIKEHGDLEELRPHIATVLEELDHYGQEASSEALTLAQEYAYLYRRRAQVPLTESSYGIDLTFARTREMADVASYYAAFGFELADGAGEMPDHLSVQLEFLGVLFFKEAYARDMGWTEQVEISLELRKNYLTDHLTGWMPVFLKTLGRHARLGFYPAAAELARHAIIMEHAAVGGGEPTMVLKPFEEAPGNEKPMTCGACPAMNDAEGNGVPPQWAVQAKNSA